MAVLQSAGVIHGQFDPFNTLDLKQLTCRISGQPWPAAPAVAVTPALYRSAARHLAALDTFHLCFESPLRVALPPEDKTPGRHFCDPGWFYRGHGAGAHLFKALLAAESAPAVAGALGFWQPVPYGRPGPATLLGGFRGWLRLRGPIGLASAETLVRHQWLGLGKNRAFGFGSYRIPEIPAGLAPLPRGRHLEMAEAPARKIAMGSVPAERALPAPAPKPSAVRPQVLAPAADQSHACRLLCRAVEAAFADRSGANPRRHHTAPKASDADLLAAFFVHWQVEELEPWLLLLASLFPNEPLCARLTAWLGSEDGAETAFQRLFDLLAATLLAHAFPAANPLPARDPAALFFSAGPLGSAQLAARCLERFRDWGLATAGWRFQPLAARSSQDFRHLRPGPGRVSIARVV